MDAVDAAYERFFSVSGLQFPRNQAVGQLYKLIMTPLSSKSKSPVFPSTEQYLPLPRTKPSQDYQLSRNYKFADVTFLRQW
jgi:hypothetical protein